jgi:hypothetical protein
MASSSSSSSSSRETEDEFAVVPAGEWIDSRWRCCLRPVLLVGDEAAAAASAAAT